MLLIKNAYMLDPATGYEGRVVFLLAILNLMYIIVLVCGDYSTEKLCTCNDIWPFLFQKAVCFAFELNIYHCLPI